METRDLYKQKFKAQIDEWSAKVDVMKAQADKMSAEGKLSAKPHLDGMHAKMEAAKAKLREIGEATDDKWEDAKKGADQTWNDTKAAIAGAFDALKDPN